MTVARALCRHRGIGGVDVVDLEIEREGLKLRLRKDAANGAVPSPPTIVVAGAPAPVVQVGPAAAPPAEPAAPVGSGAAEVELAVVKSPIVGTFYRSAEPGAKPFVSVGDVVRKGQVLCIIEAMKLMNEIDSEYDGEITSIYIENGQAVQYGERLFSIKPTN